MLVAPLGDADTSCLVEGSMGEIDWVVIDRRLLQIQYRITIVFYEVERVEPLCGNV